MHGVAVGDGLVLQHAAQPPGGLRLVPGVLQAGTRLHLQTIVGFRVQGSGVATASCLEFHRLQGDCRVQTNGLPPVQHM